MQDVRNGIGSNPDLMEEEEEVTLSYVSRKVVGII